MPKRAKPESGKPKPWAKRIVGHADLPAKSIVPNPKNFRLHPDTQSAAVSEAISRLGWIEEVLINKTTGNLLNGHLRVKLAAARNENVPVSYVELSPAEEALALASLDPLGDLAIQDSGRLSELLSGLDLGESPLDQFLNSFAEDASLSVMFDEETGETSSGSDSRAPIYRQPNITIVLPIKDLSIFEQAITATGKKNRGEAIVEICRRSMGEEGQLDI